MLPPMRDLNFVKQNDTEEKMGEPFPDLPRINVSDSKWIEENETDLQKLHEIILSEVKHVEKKTSASLISISDEVRGLERAREEARLRWEEAARQRDCLERDVEGAARERLQCRLRQQEADCEKAAFESRCAALMRELADLKSGKEKMKVKTKQRWEKLVYAAMHYKLRLECHISLDKQEEHTFTLEFFQTERGSEVLYFAKLSYDRDGSWALLDMHPRLAQYDRLCKYLAASQDVQRLVVFLHRRFAHLRDDTYSK